jgi:hypothetical protein
MGLDVGLVVVRAAVVMAMPPVLVRLNVGLVVVVAAVVGAAMAVSLDLGLIVLGAVVGAAMAVSLDVGLATLVTTPMMVLSVAFELVHGSSCLWAVTPRLPT